MIIGAETEYGILGYNPKTNYITQCHLTSAEVVDSVSGMFPVFERTLDGIEDEDEHREIELSAQRSFTLRDLVDLVLKPVSKAKLQRRGMSGMVLPNGARFYIDCRHPEYSIPEASDPFSAMIYQKAGDFIVNRCRKLAEERLRSGRALHAKYAEHPMAEIMIDRANSDGKGSSYAGHENYSVSPKTFKRIVGGTFSEYGDLSHAWMTFMAARQIIAGAGKVGSERGKPVAFQISARADFIERETSCNTVQKRPIINTRDIPYADERAVRRLHVICGDSNMSQVSLFLKFGVTALFLMMLESGFLESQETILGVPLLNPVLSYRNIARDTSLEHRVVFSNGAKKTALDIMYESVMLMKKFLSQNPMSGVWHEAALKAEGALNGLSSDRHRHEISRNLDWVVKERVIKTHAARKNIELDHPECHAINLYYHRINPENKKNIFYRLEEKGEIMQMAAQEEIALAVSTPPKDTRAGLRGYLVANHSKDISSIGWHHVFFKDGTVAVMPDPSSFEVRITDAGPDGPRIIGRAQEFCRGRLINA